MNSAAISASVLVWSGMVGARGSGTYLHAKCIGHLGWFSWGVAGLVWSGLAWVALQLFPCSVSFPVLVRFYRGLEFARVIC
jgi:hypothetical protein